MKFLLLLLTLIFIHCPIQALELNYRLLDKPHIQSFIDNQLDSINGRFSNFVINVLGIEQNTGEDLSNFVKNYNDLGALITLFRKNCIYSLLDSHKSKSTIEDSCQLISKKLLSQIRLLDDGLSKYIMNAPKSLSKNSKAISDSNAFIYLHFTLNNIISKLEPSIASVEYISQSRTQVADQFSLEIGNQLSLLQKVIRQSITELVPHALKRDLESFWLFYINVLQERATLKERRDYWTVNVFDLNIKVNEFFYSCERNKRLLSNDSYNICDDIHKDWNNILRQTLKF
jgi:hypothetical protein